MKCEIQKVSKSIKEKKSASPIRLFAKAEFIRRELSDVYDAFFVGWQNWSPSNRFQMKGKLWTYLHSAAEEVARDGMDTDPESLEIARLIITTCRELETKCLCDLDKLEDVFGLVEDFNETFDMKGIA